MGKVTAQSGHESNHLRGLRALSGACLGLLLGGIGCGGGSPRLSLEPTATVPRAADYPAALALWTRQTSVLSFKHLDTTIRLHATLFSPHLTAAYLAKYSDMFKLPGRDRSEMATGFANNWATSYPFLVAAATTQREWNDLGETDSVWRVALVNDLEQQVSPLEVEVKRDITATTREFFPFIEPFYKVYFVRFPRTLEDGRALVGPETQSLTLRIAGPLGVATLEWRLR